MSKSLATLGACPRIDDLLRKAARLALMLTLAGPILLFSHSAAALTEVVTFIGNEVVDLTWDPISTERYEVTRNGAPSGCVPKSGIVTGKIYCRDTGLTDGETYTYKVEAVTGTDRTLIGEKTVTTGFVKGAGDQRRCAEPWGRCSCGQSGAAQRGGGHSN